MGLALAICDTLCASGFMNDLILAHSWPYGSISKLLPRVTSLRRCAQANASVALYWWRRVLDDGGRRD